MKTVKIVVTQKLIDEANKILADPRALRTRNCPVALAAALAFQQNGVVYSDLSVASHHINVQAMNATPPYSFGVVLPAEVQLAIQNYDDGEGFYPIEFTMEVPESEFEKRTENYN